MPMAELKHRPHNTDYSVQQQHSMQPQDVRQSLKKERTKIEMQLQARCDEMERELQALKIGITNAT